MGEISNHIGKKIRQYRQMKKLSLSEFSLMIHKSKSTLSKYENGEIAMDVETLFEITHSLQISVYQLMQGLGEKVETVTKGGDKVQHQYLYVFDGRTGKLIRGRLETTIHATDLPANVTLYYNVPNLEKQEGYKSLYYGTMTQRDSVTNYVMQNQTNTVENIFMCVLNSLEVQGKRVGIITGISSRSFLPTSMKFVLSDMVLEEDQELLHTLVLNREDFALMKKYNMFIVDQRD